MLRLTEIVNLRKHADVTQKGCNDISSNARENKYRMCSFPKLLNW